ncbi:hypothetical protein, partial [Clostridium sp. HBUAS56010]|uniref:hypothetical protein n=1 Tax=Clostridium sp. HBUAS56010 TaxID=2571127 RepID=UPI001A9B1862
FKVYMQKTGYPILLLGFSGFVFVHDTNMILFPVISLQLRCGGLDINGHIRCLPYLQYHQFVQQ